MHKPRKIHPLVALVAAAALIALFITIGTANSLLPAYTGEEQPASAPSVVSVPAPVTVSTVEYLHEEPNFRIEVPEDWTRVTKNGMPTFIHAPSASALQLQVSAFDAAVTAVDELAAYEDVTALGGELLEFYLIHAQGFVVLYRTQSGSGTLANIDITYFDASHIVRLCFTINEEYYAQLDGQIAGMIDSFQWPPQGG